PDLTARMLRNPALSLEWAVGCAIDQQGKDDLTARVEKQCAALAALEGQRNRLLIGTSEAERIPYTAHAEPDAAESECRNFQTFRRADGWCAFYRRQRLGNCPVAVGEAVVGGFDSPDWPVGLEIH